MFSFLKKSATPEQNVLQELNEEQLLQVAGGSGWDKDSYNDHDADDMKKKHHHHHHHSHKNEHKVWDDDHDSFTWAPNMQNNGYSSGKW